MVSSEKILSAARHNWWLNSLGFVLSFVASVVLVRVVPRELLFRGGDPTDLAGKLRSLLNRTSAQRNEIGLYLREQVERLHSLPRLATRVLDELQPLRPNQAPAFPQRVTPEEECPC